MFVWHEQENAATAAQALADAVAAALQAALNEKGHAVLAVSGGRSPIAFFEALSQKDLNWQNIGITLVDERIVPDIRRRCSLKRLNYRPQSMKMMTRH